MALQIIVRLARNEDLLKRQELVRQGFAAHNWSAFWYFFLQELTLECCVLGAAVLFIFFGVSVSACLTLVPAAAAFVALVVYCSHYALAQKHAQSLNNEMFGVVAEIKGGLLLTPQQANPIYFQFESMEKESLNQSSEYSHLVGTVSVSEYWGLESKGWLHALAVHNEWRAVGVGRALVRGAQAAAERGGLAALEAAASLLQPSARAVLHRTGWECTSAYDRPFLGAALTLPLVRLARPLTAP